jgi:hypothetical protein
VQWYSESGDCRYFRDEPCIDISSSSELRLAGFSAEQSRGQRAINKRLRRGNQAAHRAELGAGAGRTPAAVLLEAEAACREVALAD